MNETRKKIIQLIEPYMDKILSEGCIVFCKKLNTYLNYFNWKNIVVDGPNDKWLGYIEKVDIDSSLINDGYEIIGHYDITAVLKYIKEINCDVNIDIDEDCFYFSWVDGYVNTPYEESITFEYEEEIPLKPLHLYTEEEEKNLLELLQRLDNTEGN